MLNVGHTRSRNCQGVSRRELLQVGALGFLGLSLADGLHAAKPKKRAETSCIFVFLEGGPSQLETFDPKPNAPADVRGPFGPVASNVPGLQLCELIPAIAARMDKCALIRPLTGFTAAHTARPALTGGVARLVTYGSCVTQLT